MHDPHGILAATIHSAKFLVTYNLAAFPATALAAHGIEAQGQRMTQMTASTAARFWQASCMDAARSLREGPNA